MEDSKSPVEVAIAPGSDCKPGEAIARKLPVLPAAAVVTFYHAAQAFGAASQGQSLVWGGSRRIVYRNAVLKPQFETQLRCQDDTHGSTFVLIGACFGIWLQDGLCIDSHHQKVLKV